MDKRANIILLVAILLLGINIGMMLSQERAQINIVPTAQAGSPAITGSGATVFTCSEDGTRLYRWSSAAASKTDNNPLYALQFEAAAKP